MIKIFAKTFENPDSVTLVKLVLIVLCVLIINGKAWTWFFHVLKYLGFRPISIEIVKFVNFVYHFAIYFIIQNHLESIIWLFNWYLQDWWKDKNTKMKKDIPNEALESVWSSSLNIWPNDIAGFWCSFDLWMYPKESSLVFYFFWLIRRMNDFKNCVRIFL